MSMNQTYNSQQKTNQQFQNTTYGGSGSQTYGGSGSQTYDPNQTFNNNTYNSQINNNNNGNRPNSQGNNNNNQLQFNQNNQGYQTYDPNFIYNNGNTYNNGNNQQFHHQSYDPNQTYDPNQGYYDPNAYYDPNQGYYDPNQAFNDPYAGQDVNPFALPDDEQFIQFKDDSRAEIKACTLEKLVEKLTANVQLIDDESVFLTYKSYADPRQLCELLFCRYFFEYLERDDINTVRHRVLTFFEKWIDKFTLDFYNANISQDVLYFVGNILEHETNNPLAAAIQFKINKLTKPKEVEKIEDIITEEFFSSAMEYPSLDIAQQMMNAEWSLWEKINIEEFIDLNWTKKEKDNLAPFVTAMSTRFNEISDRFATILCTTKKIKERTKVLSKLIEIAEYSKEIGNFNGFMEIYSTLQRGPIRRLKKTFLGLSSTEKALIESHKTLVECTNHMNMRALMKESTPPIIPYLGMYLSDILFINQGSADHLNGMINTMKLMRNSEIFKQIKIYQQHDSKVSIYPPNGPLTQMLQSIPVLNEEILYEISNYIEPRDGKEMSGKEPAELTTYLEQNTPSKQKAVSRLKLGGIGSKLGGIKKSSRDEPIKSSRGSESNTPTSTQTPSTNTNTNTNTSTPPVTINTTPINISNLSNSSSNTHAAHNSPTVSYSPSTLDTEVTASSPRQPMVIKNKEHSPYFKKSGSSGISSPKIVRDKDSPRSNADSDGEKGSNSPAIPTRSSSSCATYIGRRTQVNFTDLFVEVDIDSNTLTTLSNITISTPVIEKVEPAGGEDNNNNNNKEDNNSEKKLSSSHKKKPKNSNRTVTLNGTEPTPSSHSNEEDEKKKKESSSAKKGSRTQRSHRSKEKGDGEEGDGLLLDSSNKTSSRSKLDEKKDSSRERNSSHSPSNLDDKKEEKKGRDRTETDPLKRSGKSSSHHRRNQSEDTTSTTPSTTITSSSPSTKITSTISITSATTTT